MLSQGINVYYISITYIRSSYAFSKPCAYSMLSTFFIFPCVRIFFAPLCTAAWTLHLVLPVRIVRFEYSLFLLSLVHPIYIAFCRLDGCRHKLQQWMRFLRIFVALLCTAAWTLYPVFPVRIVPFEYSLFLLSLARPIYIACRVVWMVVDKSHNSECDSLLGTWAVVLIYYPLYIVYTVVIIVVCMLFYPEFMSPVLIDAFEWSFPLLFYYRQCNWDIFFFVLRCYYIICVLCFPGFHCCYCDCLAVAVAICYVFFF